jgi:hypothetical protein
MLLRATFVDVIVTDGNVSPNTEVVQSYAHVTVSGNMILKEIIKGEGGPIPLEITSF